jgi:hypothetical protein
MWYITTIMITSGIKSRGWGRNMLVIYHIRDRWAIPSVVYDQHIPAQSPRFDPNYYLWWRVQNTKGHTLTFIHTSVALFLSFVLANELSTQSPLNVIKVYTLTEEHFDLLCLYYNLRQQTRDYKVNVMNLEGIGPRWEIVADTYLLKLQRLQNKVLRTT